MELVDFDNRPKRRTEESPSQVLSDHGDYLGETGPCDATREHRALLQPIQGYPGPGLRFIRHKIR